MENWHDLFRILLKGTDLIYFASPIKIVLIAIGSNIYVIQLRRCK
jgi:hypothetical protein